MSRAPLLTLSLAVSAMAALKELHRVCEAMDAERDGDRPSEDVYQAATAQAARVLAKAPPLPHPPAQVGELPPLPKPKFEDIDYEIWGQNAKCDAYTADQMRTYARAALASARPSVPQEAQITADQTKELFHKYGTGRLEGFTAALAHAFALATPVQPQPAPEATQRELRLDAYALIREIDSAGSWSDRRMRDSFWRCVDALRNTLTAAPSVDGQMALDARRLDDSAPQFIPLRAKGVLDGDNNLDCWDTPPYDLAAQHVNELQAKDPAAAWRLDQLYVLAHGTAAPESSPDARRWQYWRDKRSVTIDVALHGNGCTPHSAAELDAAADAAMNAALPPSVQPPASPGLGDSTEPTSAVSRDQ